MAIMNTPKLSPFGKAKSLSNQPPDPALWNSPLGRRRFLQATGKATAVTVIAANGLMFEVAYAESASNKPKIKKWQNGQLKVDSNGNTVEYTTKPTDSELAAMKNSPPAAPASQVPADPASGDNPGAGWSETFFDTILTAASLLPTYPKLVPAHSPPTTTNPYVASVTTSEGPQGIWTVMYHWEMTIVWEYGTP